MFYYRRNKHISIARDMWHKQGESQSEGFSAAVWMCPCFPICRSWLSLVVPSVGRVRLPVLACACHHSITFSMHLSLCKGLLHCPFWTNIIASSAPPSPPPSLLMPSFCPLRACLSSHSNPWGINIYYTLHSGCNKRLYSACFSESINLCTHLPKVRTDLNRQP